MKSDMKSSFDNYSQSASNYDLLHDDLNFENILKQLDFNNLNSNYSGPNRKFTPNINLLENRKKIKFAIENFVNDELIEITNKNYLFDNFINLEENETKFRQVKEQPHDLKKTSLKILTETSEIEVNYQNEKINSHIYPTTSTPTNYNNCNKNFNHNHLKTTAVRSINSFSNWQHSTSGGVSTIKMKKSKSRLHNVYELSMMSERSVYSKSTLRKAEEFLECLRNKEEMESCREIDMNNNGTLNCYLMTDHTIGEGSHMNTKIWNAEKEIQVNQAICFNIMGKHHDDRFNLNDKNEREELTGDINLVSNSNGSKKNNGRIKDISMKTIFFMILAVCLNLIFVLMLLSNFNKNRALKSNYAFTIECINNFENNLIPIIKEDKYELVFHKNIKDIYDLN